MGLIITDNLEKICTELQLKVDNIPLQKSLVQNNRRRQMYSKQQERVAFLFLTLNFFPFLAPLLLQQCTTRCCWYVCINISVFMCCANMGVEETGIYQHKIIQKLDILYQDFAGLWLHVLNHTLNRDNPTVMRQTMGCPAVTCTT